MTNGKPDKILRFRLQQKLVTIFDKMILHLDFSLIKNVFAALVILIFAVDI